MTLSRLTELYGIYGDSVFVKGMEYLRDRKAVEDMSVEIFDTIYVQDIEDEKAITKLFIEKLNEALIRKLL